MSHPTAPRCAKACGTFDDFFFLNDAPLHRGHFPKLDIWTIIISRDKNLLFMSCFARCICV